MELGASPGAGNLASPANGAATQTTVAVGATQVLATRSSRFRCKLQNQDPRVTVYYGFANTVTTANGFRLDPKGETDWLDTTAPIWAIADDPAGADVRALEIYS